MSLSISIYIYIYIYYISASAYIFINIYLHLYLYLPYICLYIWEFPKIKAPMQTPKSRALIIRTPTKMTPNLQKQPCLYQYLSTSVSISAISLPLPISVSISIYIYIYLYHIAASSYISTGEARKLECDRPVIPKQNTKGRLP